MIHWKARPSIRRGTRFIILVQILSAPGLAAQPVEFHPALNAPKQQSECEAASNKYKAAHPDMKMFDRHTLFPFPFGDAQPPGASFAFKDKISGVTLYVESDGRHIAAIESSGKLMWVRNPFVDSDLCPYRSAHPFIRRLGSVSVPDHPDARLRTDAGANALARESLKYPVEFLIKKGRLKEAPRSDDRFLDLAFNSSQFGYLNIRNGDFYFMGQN